MKRYAVSDFFCLFLYLNAKRIRKIASLNLYLSPSCTHIFRLFTAATSSFIVLVQRCWFFLLNWESEVPVTEWNAIMMCGPPKENQRSRHTLWAATWASSYVINGNRGVCLGRPRLFATCLPFSCLHGTLVSRRFLFSRSSCSQVWIGCETWRPWSLIASGTSPVSSFVCQREVQTVMRSTGTCCKNLAIPPERFK